MTTYAYFASTLAGPLFFGYALRNRCRLTPTAAISSMLAGIFGCAGAHLTDTAVPCAVYGIGTSALTLILCAVLTTMRSDRTENDAAVKKTA